MEHCEAAKSHASGFYYLTSCPGFPYEVMESPHYVPGNDRGENARYKQKPLWNEIMKVTDDVCIIYGFRVHKDFNSKVSKDSAKKLKAGVCQILIF